MLEQFLNGAAKRWWKPSINYVVGNVIEPLGAIHGQVYKCIQAGTSGAAEPAWPVEDYSEFTDGQVRWRTLSLESQSGNVGDIRFPAMTVKPNEIKLNGATLLRASYPELWEWAQLNGLVVDQTAWTNSKYGLFNSGDGSTTFVVPELRGEFLRVLAEGRTADNDGKGRTLGERQGDAIRNIWARWNNHRFPDTAGAVVNLGAIGTQPYQGGSIGLEQYLMELAASYTVPTGSDNRPRNIPYYAVIRYK